MRKKLILLSLFIIFYTITHAQYAGWMKGTWKSTSGTTTLSGNVTSTIQIDDISGESFTGTKTSEINGAKITISISGSFRGKGLYLQDGQVLHREGPENGQWYDCSACTQVNKMIISRDSLILVSSISGCDKRCDGETFFYRLLSEYDDPAQHYLVDRFGRPSDIIGFHPYSPKEGQKVISLDDNDPLKNVVVSAVATDRNRLQQKDDSIRIAQQRKRQQEITDSINLAKQKKQQRIKDSLDNIARIKQQQIDDATRIAQQKKREQEIADSLNLVQQKEKRRLKDSLDNAARLEQIRLRTEDSLRDVQAKKRQQEIADSLGFVKQREQQHTRDSLDNIARIRQQQIDDSTLLAQQKKRQQEIADSINLVQQREQQRIKDSLDNVARLEQIRKRTEDSLQSIATANLQKQRTADSLRDVQARERQQEITDSLAAVRKQQYNDSLQKAALAKAVPPPTDSNRSAADKALTSRTSVLLETYHITSPDILIELFDNGEIDSDRVSVYHNNAIVVSNQMLGIKPITLNIHADATNREHEFVLVAENLGSIPPNSALMRITAGKQSYKLPVKTDMKTNARIVFYYDGN